MNAEHQVLAEYLEGRFDRRFNVVDAALKDIKRDIKNLTLHVDGKNDKQDDVIEDHELRISALESDYRVITS